MRILIVKGLGLKKLNQVVERPDTPEIRGMVFKIPHLVKIVEKLFLIRSNIQVVIKRKANMKISS